MIKMKVRLDRVKVELNMVKFKMNEISGANCATEAKDL